MAEIVGLAAVASAGVLFLVFKLGRVRRILTFSVPIDIAASSLLLLSMAGTFSGIMIALVAGTMISVVLWAMKLIFGCEMLTHKGWVAPPRPERKGAFRRYFA